MEFLKRIINTVLGSSVIVAVIIMLIAALLAWIGISLPNREHLPQGQPTEIFINP